MPQAIDLGDLFYSLQSLCNVQQNGNIRPQTDFQNWVNDIQTEMFWEYVDEFQKNQQISDKLSPFLNYVNVAVTPISGSPTDLIPLPSNYGAFAMLSVLRQIDDGKCCCQENNINGDPVPILYNGTQWLNPSDPQYAQMAQQFKGTNLQESLIELIDTQFWDACLDHDIKRPTFKKPKCVQYSGGLRLAPKGITMVYLTYFTIPVPAVFSYTISNDIPIYNQSGSTQMLWNATLKDEFLRRLKIRYDKYIGDSAGFQMDNADNNANKP
jgi:hypothetical protein